MANTKAPDFLVYGKSDLLTEIEELFAGKVPKKTIRKIIDGYEEIIREHLLEAKPKMPIEVRPWVGLRLQSFIVAPKVTDTPFGKQIEVPERIRCKAKSTRYFTRCLNDQRDEG